MRYTVDSGLVETIAFIAAGAANAAAKHESDTLGPFEAYTEYMNEVTRHAANLERVASFYKKHPDSFPGVWAYEIAEEFGFDFGRALLRSCEDDTDAPDPDARALVLKLLSDAKWQEPEKAIRKWRGRA